ncbi:MAG: hypothetical protein ABI353_19815, partial [Isosphaeraceae bacterium]
MLLRQDLPRQRRRRGIVLVLILGMLGLLALIGVTFASFAGQSQISSRHYAEALAFPDSDQVMDYALSQLINDTDNPGSALRGHSLKRDMYGADALFNGALNALPSSGNPLSVSGSTKTTDSDGNVYYTITTNIPTPSNTANAQDLPAYYGTNLIGWTLRLQPLSGMASQTFQITGVDISGNYHRFTLSRSDPTPNLVQPDTVLNVQFSLDGRSRNAFNGTGVGRLAPVSGVINPAQYANFRFNGNLLTGNTSVPMYHDFYSNLLGLGLPSMDEDYDAADLENWFLAIQSADGSVVLPSFHRPSIIQVDPTVVDPVTGLPFDDWTSPKVAARAKFLRPRAIDHPAAGIETFPDLRPDTTGSPDPTTAAYNPNYGKITYEVD